MHNLLDFVRKYSYFFLFLLLETLSMVMLFRFNSFQGSVWFSAANGAVTYVNGLYADVTNYLYLTDVNRDLTDKNIALQTENERLRQALSTVTRDTTLTEKLMQEKLVGYQMLPATVVKQRRARQ